MNLEANLCDHPFQETPGGKCLFNPKVILRGTWEEGQQICSWLNENSRLVEIRGYEELEDVTSYLLENDADCSQWPSGGPWIGAVEVQDTNQFIWSSDNSTVVIENWLQGQPNNPTSGDGAMMACEFSYSLVSMAAAKNVATNFTLPSFSSLDGRVAWSAAPARRRLGMLDILRESTWRQLPNEGQIVDLDQQTLFPNSSTRAVELHSNQIGRKKKEVSAGGPGARRSRYPGSGRDVPSRCTTSSATSCPASLSGKFIRGPRVGPIVFLKHAHLFVKNLTMLEVGLLHVLFSLTAHSSKRLHLSSGIQPELLPSSAVDSDLFLRVLLFHGLDLFDLFLRHSHQEGVATHFSCRGVLLREGLEESNPLLIDPVVSTDANEEAVPPDIHTLLRLVTCHVQRVLLQPRDLSEPEGADHEGFMEKITDGVFVFFLHLLMRVLLVLLMLMQHTWQLEFEEAPSPWNPPTSRHPPNSLEVAVIGAGRTSPHPPIFC
ncbi:unnamed protein product [Cyprideis torosa]|uniref:Uncharacterized protein n=1 Tax=Cyprideis torosa TaxID=163714 RepID=A0A7R8ZU55_9CRUS|nr:unnamed protein product [Cyprideis torosa]CAG0899582.1 unnamed protein product [Cyprideis torosa]